MYILEIKYVLNIAQTDILLRNFLDLLEFQKNTLKNFRWC